MIFGNAKYFSQISFLSVKRAAGCSSVSEIPQGRFRPPHSCAHAHTHGPTAGASAQFRQIDGTGEVMPLSLARLWWMRRSPGLSARAQIEAPLKNGTLESMWSVFPRAPSKSGERTLARAPSSFSLSLSLSVSRYSAGNKLVFSQPSGPRFISWPSIPIQHQCNRCCVWNLPSISICVFHLQASHTSCLVTLHLITQLRDCSFFPGSREGDKFKMANIEN